MEPGTGVLPPPRDHDLVKEFRDRLRGQVREKFERGRGADGRRELLAVQQGGHLCPR
ncbi:hypothetical protein ACR6C2_04885 [Streptomyces sp. INA 01156]